jgi:hypothetical protein
MFEHTAFRKLPERKPDEGANFFLKSGYFIQRVHSCPVGVDRDIGNTYRILAWRLNVISTWKTNKGIEM